MSDGKETGEKVVLDEYKKEKAEFAEALDEIFSAEEGESDEDINKRLDEKVAKTDTAGEATRDQDEQTQTPVVTEDKTDSTEDPEAGQSGVDPTATTEESSSEDWKARALAAEADLVKEKQKTSSWAGRIKKANERVKELEGQIETTPSEEDLSDQAKIDKFREDFPELGDVVDVMQRKIDKQKPTVSPDPDPVVDSGDDLETTPTAADGDEPTDHYKTITKAHPDLDEMVKSGVLLTWINTQPAFIKPHLTRIYEGGDAQQVTDMCTEFKDKTKWRSQIDTNQGKKQDKINSMIAPDGSESAGPKDPGTGPDMNDYEAAAKEAGL